MPIEIRGTRVRVRVKRPIKGAKYRTDDVGTKGHSQRIAMYSKKTKKWSTQSWTFPVADVKKKRPATMKILKKLGYTRRALKLVR